MFLRCRRLSVLSILILCAGLVEVCSSTTELNKTLAGRQQYTASNKAYETVNHKNSADPSEAEWKDYAETYQAGDATVRDFWQKRTRDELYAELNRKHNTNRAKNVVFFIGDGYSVVDQTVARIYKDQLYGRTPLLYNKLAYETFAELGQLRTLPCNNFVTDSAAATTAYVSGGKANTNELNVPCRVVQNSCVAALKENQYEIITELVQKSGRAIGVVTTTRVTHDTPGALYAHTTNRNWESDADKPAAALANPACEKDSARQLVENYPGRTFDVVLGGGKSYFLPTSAGGRRLDGRDLIAEWRSSHENATSAVFVDNRAALLAVDAQNTDFLLGLFSPSHMTYQLDRITGPAPPVSTTPEQIQAAPFPEPTLLEMSQKALAILQAKSSKQRSAYNDNDNNNNNNNGFFLFIEGGKIDLAHHDNFYPKSLQESLELERVIKWVVENTNQEDTLIVLTSDHSQSNNFAGYISPQSNSILGGAMPLTEPPRVPYTSLLYNSGPGGLFSQTGPRPPYNANGGDPLTDKNYRQQALVYLLQSVHTGDDVAVFANGPWAHLLNGQHDNTYLYGVLSYAMGLSSSSTTNSSPSSSPSSGAYEVENNDEETNVPYERNGLDRNMTESITNSTNSTKPAA